MTKYAPRHLSDGSRAWFREVLKTYDLEPHHEKLLTLACEAWDRAQQAREILEEDGIIVIDRFGQEKPHPAVNIELQNRNAFAKMLRELDLDVDPPPEPHRPPGLPRYINA
jgi:P27 family predicted phage terminase small subunit